MSVVFLQSFVMDWWLGYTI